MDAPSAAPAAGNVTATPNGNANGATGPQNPALPPKPKPNVAPVAAKPAAKPEPKKGPDGKFVSPDSGTARPVAEETEEPKKDPYRFKRRIKADGQEVDVDLDEDGIAREIGIARAARGRLKELREHQERIRQEEEDGKKDPMSALERMAERLGVDPDELATRRLAQKATRQLMSPEEQRMADLEARNQQLEAYRQAQERKAELARLQAEDDAHWKREEPAYIAAMEKAKLPRDVAVLGFMAKVGQELTEALGEKYQVPPDAVVAETNERLGKFAEHYVFSLPPEVLAEKLGKERVAALMKWKMDQWRASQSNAEPVPVAPEAPPPAPFIGGAPREYKTEADIRRALRERYK